MQYLPITVAWAMAGQHRGFKEVYGSESPEVGFLAVRRNDVEQERIDLPEHKKALLQLYEFITQWSPSVLYSLQTKGR
jgi:hypothetical protein